MSGLKLFIEEVKNEKFPDEDHSYNVDMKELEKFKKLVEKRKTNLTILTFSVCFPRL